MRKATKFLSISLVLSAGAAMAEQTLYPVESVDNFCPAGLRPVTHNGEVYCGIPNQEMTYNAVMSQRIKRTSSQAKMACGDGAESCD
jgi:hypothetical protein